MADIFISYAREDRSDAERLARAFAAEGLSVWWDLESLRSGQSFNRAIQQALEGAACVVVLWSRTSVGSKWVESEAYWAWEHDKLHSVRLDASVPLPVPFNTYYARSLAAWDGETDSPELRRLTADILAVVGPRERVPVAPAAPPANRTVPFKEPASGSGTQVESSPNLLPVDPERAAVSAPSDTRLFPQSGSAFEDKQGSEQSKTVPGQRHGATGRATRRYQISTPVIWVLVVLGALGTLAAVLSVVRPKPQPDTPAVVSAPSGPRSNAPADSQVPKSSQDCPACPTMLRIPAGSFQMGSLDGQGEGDEYPRHTVRIARPFAIGQTEVTFDQWDACVAAGGCSRKASDAGWGRGDRPAINVSWDDAQEYVAWLSKTTGNTYRLPTEAEWEYATRAGTDTAWSFGGTADNLEKYAWFTANAAGKTHPVGEKDPNPWGLHDVHGNVWEWVQDCWNSSYLGAPADGSAWEGGDCSRRVVRGGSWFLEPRHLRSANRSSNEVNWRDTNFGFRVTQDL